MSGVLVLVELADGAPDRLSAEALGLAGRIAGSVGGGVDAVVVAASDEAVVAERGAASLGGYGVSTVHLVTSDRLASYAPAAWAAAVAGVVTGGSYTTIVAPPSERATEVLAHVAEKERSR